MQTARSFAELIGEKRTGLLFGRQDLGLELVGDRLGNLGLNGKDVGEIAIVSLRPQMRIAASVD